MNTFCHLPDDIIEINGEKFDLELFLEVEPEYSLPEGMVGRKYDENKHILHSSDSSFVGELPWEDGERYVTRSPDLKLLIDTIEEDNKFVDSLRDVAQLTKEGEYPRMYVLVIALL